MTLQEAIGHKCRLALEDAEAHGAISAATFLKVDVMDLLREVHRRAKACTDCEYRPRDSIPPRDLEDHA